MQVKFSDQEVEVLRFLAKRFDENNHWCGVNELPGYDTNAGILTENMIERFKRYGLVSWQSIATFNINREVLEIVHQIDNPPLPDYWETFLAWFRSKRWSVAAFLFFAFVSFLGGLLSLVNTALALINR